MRSESRMSRIDMPVFPLQRTQLEMSMEPHAWKALSLWQHKGPYVRSSTNSAETHQLCSYVHLRCRIADELAPCKASLKFDVHDT